MKLKRILSASIIKTKESFIWIIGNEPYGKYKDPTHNPFSKQNSVISDTTIPMENFQRWKIKSLEVLTIIIV